MCPLAATDEMWSQPPIPEYASAKPRILPPSPARALGRFQDERTANSLLPASRLPVPRQTCPKVIAPCATMCCKNRNRSQSSPQSDAFNRAKLGLGKDEKRDLVSAPYSFLIRKTTCESRILNPQQNGANHPPPSRQSNVLRETEFRRDPNFVQYQNRVLGVNQFEVKGSCSCTSKPNAPCLGSLFLNTNRLLDKSEHGSALVKYHTQNESSRRCFCAFRKCQYFKCNAPTVGNQESPPEYGISVAEGSEHVVHRSGLHVKELNENEPEYQNLRELINQPEYANLTEIMKKYGYRQCPEGQNLEDEAIYENIHSVRVSQHQRILSSSASSVCFVPVSDVQFYEKKGYVLSTEFYSGTFPQYFQKDVKLQDLAQRTWSHQKNSARSRIVCPVSSSISPDFGAKKEMYDVKKQRLYLAQNEYEQLNNALSTLATSRTSLCSGVAASTSSGSARHDPGALRADVSAARGRVAQLRRELRQARADVACARRGVDTLAEVEQKLNAQQGGCYNITEAQAIMTELKNIQKSLTSGEKEKAELMQSLAKLKDDLTRLQLGEVSPDVSTLSLPHEKLSTASQTDLCAELVPIGTRLAEMARMRLQYDEERKRIQQIQQQLADLEDKVQPGQAESDKDRLLLFQEKEQLLRELRSITPRTRSKQEMTDIQLECKKLEQDLNNALEISNRCIADRLRLHEEKQLLLQQLRDALRSMTTLESQLKSVSASTLSVSSSSSLGSLSTTSSKGSLSSGLSFTDIYGGPQGIASTSGTDKPIDMVDLHRRVERLLRGAPSYSECVGVSPSRSQPSLSPRSSLSSASPPPHQPPPAYLLTSASPPPHQPPPTYSQVERQRRQQQLDDRLSAEARRGQVAGDTYGHNSALSPICETPSPLLTAVALSAPRSPSSPASTVSTASVSAAVSDESVAGDSGVFEAASTSNTVSTAQVEINLRYSCEEGTLNICMQRIRNLHVLLIAEGTRIYIKAALLPCAHPSTASAFVTRSLPVGAVSAGNNVPLLFGETFVASVSSLTTVRSSTLQINVWCVGLTRDKDECLGCCQVSLADFPGDDGSNSIQKWYNVLSFRYLQPPAALSNQSAGPPNTRGNKEESSDESTIISSQTSTLTRSQDNEQQLQQLAQSVTQSAAINATLPPYLTPDCFLNGDTMSSDEDVDDPENIEESEELGETDLDDEQLKQMIEAGYAEELALLAAVGDCQEEEELSIVISTAEKETNTECNFGPEGGKGLRRLSHQQQRNSSSLICGDDRLATIKRSQTFSPPQNVTGSQYICRLNRSESDSSMPLYQRGGPAPYRAYPHPPHSSLSGQLHPVPFDRTARERRSLRWGRLPSLQGAARQRLSTSSTHQRQKTQRTSLDLALDLKAQHRRLADLRDEIQGLTDLKQRLEEARTRSNTSMGSWATEESALEALEALGALSGSSAAPTDRRHARLIARTCREMYRLRKTKTGKGRPDIVTFREKMAFFTRHGNILPMLSADDELLDDDPDDLEHLSSLLSNLECGDVPKHPVGRETPDGCHSHPDSLLDVRQGYEVRRSGRCKNVKEKSEKLLENSCSFDEKDAASGSKTYLGNERDASDLNVSSDSVDKCSIARSESKDTSGIVEDNSALSTNPSCSSLDTRNSSSSSICQKVNEQLTDGSVPAKSENSEEIAGRYQYVVDRVLGVQV